MKAYIQTLSLITLSLSLVACGGGNSTTTNYTKGTLVVPESISAKSIDFEIIKRKAHGISSRAKHCSNVPNGYSPLKNADVKFLDASGAEIKSTTTDDCGKFSIVASDDIVKVKATSAGNKDLVTDVKVFSKNSGYLSVASTIPATANYQISSIQITNDNKIAFSVTDTATNHAVIGMPQSAVTAKINSSDSVVTSLANASNVADPASITLVMDASGSMNDNVKDANGDYLVDPSDSSNYTRFRMAAIAAHTYLNNMPVGDETAITIFDGSVNFMDDAEMDRIFNYISSLPNASQVRVPYAFSTSGFTKTAGDLRLIVDSYNPESEIVTSYGNYGTPPGPIRKHPNTPDLKLFASVYPWDGTTAAYDAMMVSLEKTNARTNTRKIVIAMTDGQDNRSSNSKTAVINYAKSKSIPVYTIGFGNNTSANAALKDIADETNASFLKVTGTDLVSAFSGIQTGITFQYLAKLTDAIQSGDTVEVTLNLGSETVTRSITK